MWYLVFMLISGGNYETVVSGPMSSKVCEIVRADLAKLALVRMPEDRDMVLVCVPSVKEVVL